MRRRGLGRVMAVPKRWPWSDAKLGLAGGIGAKGSVIVSGTGRSRRRPREPRSGHGPDAFSAHAELASRTDARSRRSHPCACDLPLRGPPRIRPLDSQRARRPSRARMRVPARRARPQRLGVAPSVVALLVAVQTSRLPWRQGARRPTGIWPGDGGQQRGWFKPRPVGNRSRSR